MQKNRYHYSKYLYCIVLLFLFLNSSNAQEQTSNSNNLPGSNAVANPSLHALSKSGADLFGTRTGYIENIGQYGNSFPDCVYMGNILYGYEGLSMPVLFTAKGLIFLQRKVKKPSRREMEKLERKGMSEEEIKEKIIPVDRAVSMEWIGANPAAEIITDGLMPHYHTYGLLQGKAKVFKKITYKEIYPGIDAEYFFSGTTTAGFEYRLLVKPGADISKIKMKYGEDVAKIKTDYAGNLIITSDIDGFSQSAPICFYADDETQRIKLSFEINNKQVGFNAPEKYNTDKAIIIDPFVSSTSTLTGQSVGKAKDIDFDYDGNVYVSGGGDGTVQKMAKFDGAGVLQWTFSGSLTVPIWTFGPSQGGWVVEKTSGKIYLGQGLAGGGFRVIRLSTGGVYDNYISTADLNFAENWKMLWNCNGGIPQILIAGGGGSANNELAILSPPGVVPATSNISGLSGGHNDISDIIIDPVTNDLYTIFSISVNTPNADNKIYKHKAPYAAASLLWSSFTGYFSLKEPFNRPYLGGSLDNSTNSITINNKYLFFWDGKNLKAFNKSSGTVAGTPLTDPGTVILQQGGIFADECNNIFIGSNNGTIKVYKFDGTTFNDAAAADITIPGFSSASVYDLEYDHARNLLYACGNGFVASFDISQYCAQPVYDITIVTNVANLSATATLTPTPPVGSTITFALFNGQVLISTNTTGIFTGLSTGITYTIKAIINEACSGTQVLKNFIITAAPPPPTPVKWGIYVPNAFTPNGDANNDVLKALVFGLKEFHYFSIYNRYGELVFTTKDPDVGWDGTFKGKKQNAGGFTWMVEAIDPSGNILRQKGATVLIR